MAPWSLLEANSLFRRRVDPELWSSMAATQQDVASQVEAFSLEAPAVLVPLPATVRLFFPARPIERRDEVPPIDSDTSLVRSRPGITGWAADTPVQPLLTAPTKRGGPQAAAAEAQRTLTKHGLASNVRVAEAKRSFKLSYTHRAHGETCRDVCTTDEPQAKQTGCLVCAAGAASLTWGYGLPLSLGPADMQDKRVTRTLHKL